jgi:hypothetical protein
MKNIIFVLALVTVFAFATNAQSKDCCSGKTETTKVEKCTDKSQTMKTSDFQKTTTTTTTAGLKDGKEVIEKEVIVTKMDKKENCGPTSTCCDVKKEKKVEKEVEKKETH